MIVYARELEAALKHEDQASAQAALSRALMDAVVRPEGVQGLRLRRRGRDVVLVRREPVADGDAGVRWCVQDAWEPLTEPERLALALALDLR